ncbi:MAG: NADH:ubiquinone oxidoreductase [Actinomycetota bacterium]|nr:NADH:ubiquinone oxidoreductase [Actinomycetota bacterium]
MVPRVVVIGLASDFGCQVQLTNMEDDLLDVLGGIDLVYWQLASSGHMPEEYDVAVIEGAVTTEAHIELLKRVRETAAAVIAIGSCALTGGIPALAAQGFDSRYEVVYGDDGVAVARGRIVPRRVSDIITVDYQVPGCPIDPPEFVHVLGRVAQGLSDRTPKEPMCAVCKMKENVCFFERDEVCLGVVTRTGCRARCVSLGRPCTGCRGLAEDANLESAFALLKERGIARDEVVRRLEIYNALEEAVGR